MDGALRLALGSVADHLDRWRGASNASRSTGGGNVAWTVRPVRGGGRGESRRTAPGPGNVSEGKAGSRERTRSISMAANGLVSASGGDTSRGGVASVSRKTSPRAVS